MFPFGNIREFLGNNQTMIEYKNFICPSNLQFSFMLNRNTCPRTELLCFGVSAHYTLCNTHKCFCGKSCIALG